MKKYLVGLIIFCSGPVFGMDLPSILQKKSGTDIVLSSEAQRVVDESKAMIKKILASEPQNFDAAVKRKLLRELVIVGAPLIIALVGKYFGPKKVVGFDIQPNYVWTFSFVVHILLRFFVRSSGKKYMQLKNLLSQATKNEKLSINDKKLIFDAINGEYDALTRRSSISHPGGVTSEQALGNAVALFFIVFPIYYGVTSAASLTPLFMAIPAGKLVSLLICVLGFCAYVPLSVKLDRQEGEKINQLITEIGGVVRQLNLEDTVNNDSANQSPTAAIS